MLLPPLAAVCCLCENIFVSIRWKDISILFISDVILLHDCMMKGEFLTSLNSDMIDIYVMLTQCNQSCSVVIICTL